MELIDKCRKIKVIITDVDGVLTDGGLYFDSNGNEMKKFNSKDGLVCQELLKEGYVLGLITGRESKIVGKRAENLGFTLIYQGCSDKYVVFEEILKEKGLKPEEIAYMGDDVNDVKIMKSVGLSACPNDAFDYVKKEVDYVCEKNGGRGAFREFADLILKNKK
jgi:3-deoxy-D-manno-octulosonate 8-phosphate phosphatase (KDO 8-P phosphatase)